MLVDANILLYAVDSESPRHDKAFEWLVSTLNGEERVGLPWLSLAAFVRIATNPRATNRPLTGPEAWKYVADWLEADRSWIPLPTDRHAEVFGSLVCRQDLRANLITDAQIAALAIEHGLAVYSADSDFARFPEIRWINPLAE